MTSHRSHESVTSSSFFKIIILSFPGSSLFLPRRENPWNEINDGAVNTQLTPVGKHGGKDHKNRKKGIPYSLNYLKKCFMDHTRRVLTMRKRREKIVFTFSASIP